MSLKFECFKCRTLQKLARVQYVVMTLKYYYKFPIYLLKTKSSALG